MQRFLEVRALCQRARRPATRLLIGLALLAPAGFMARARTAVDVVDAAASTPAAEVLVTEASAEAAPVGEDEARSAVMAAWHANIMERERAELTARLAAEFDISLDLADQIHLAAVEERIDPVLGAKLVRAESSFRTAAVSPVGAVGLTQLLPSTARWVAPGTSRGDLFEPATNLRVGFRYLRQLLEKYGGDEELALTAYNRGPGTVNKLLKRGRDPDNGYAEKVLEGSSSRHTRLMNAKFGRRG